MTSDKAQISLYKQSKAGLKSLFVQTTQVAFGWGLILILTAGKPPGWLVSVSFFVGIAFVAWRESKRQSELEIEINVMKASEVLARYAAGERNFQRVNLRGQSFKGEDLSGADFSEADIRSTNFTGANLTRANFIGAKAGLSYFWFSTLAVSILTVSALSAFLPAIAGAVAGDNFTQLVIGNLTNIEEFKSIFATVLILITFVPITFVTITQGLVVGASAVLVILLIIGVIGWIPTALGSSGFQGLGAIAVTIAWGGIGTLFQMFFGAIFGQK